MSLLPHLADPPDSPCSLIPSSLTPTLREIANSGLQTLTDLSRFSSPTASSPAFSSSPGSACAKARQAQSSSAWSSASIQGPSTSLCATRSVQVDWRAKNADVAPSFAADSVSMMPVCIASLTDRERMNEIGIRIAVSVVHMKTQPFLSLYLPRASPIDADLLTHLRRTALHTDGIPLRLILCSDRHTDSGRARLSRRWRIRGRCVLQWRHRPRWFGAVCVGLDIVESEEKDLVGLRIGRA